MLDVCLLGTGGMMPMPDRFLSSMMLRFNGRLILVDCGEGTQVTLKSKGWGFKAIDAIVFTHYHADHISGLPGMLLAIANAKREKPLKLIGPKGLVEVVTALRTIVADLPYDIEYIVLDEPDKNVMIGDIEVKYTEACHSIECLAYRFNVIRAGKFDIDKATQLNIPKEYWSKWQKGETVSYNGTDYPPETVMGSERKGISVSFCTDSRPFDGISNFVKDSDLFICEGMYGDDAKLDKAQLNRHMLFSEAAKAAFDGNVSLLWLTHFSPALSEPEEYDEFVKNIFPNTVIGRDRLSVSLYFNGNVVYTD